MFFEHLSNLVLSCVFQSWGPIHGFSSGQVVEKLIDRAGIRIDCLLFDCEILDALYALSSLQKIAASCTVHPTLLDIHPFSLLVPRKNNLDLGPNTSTDCEIISYDESKNIYIYI